MTSTELIKMLRHIVTDVKTLYVMGGWGQPLTDANKIAFINGYEFNSRAERKAKINAAPKNCFAMDCVCGIKSILDGFIGDESQQYGGATRNKPIPDVTITKLYTDYCNGQSEDMNDITPGEFVVNKTGGHCGIYLGPGEVWEVTYSGTDGAQIRWRDGYWVKHARFNCVKYEEAENMLTDELIKSFKLQKGDKNTAVKAMQQALIDKGFSCGSYGTDGSFGSDTKLAVAKYQQALVDAGIKVIVSGIADFVTLDYLRR